MLALDKKEIYLGKIPIYIQSLKYAFFEVKR
jgi:hypothetical protein